MPLPEGFSEWEHLQDTVRLDHNKAVKQYFKNQPDDDLSTPKSSLKHACIIKDEDTATMTMMRMWLFEITLRHAQSVQAPIYGIPTSSYHDSIAFVPQVRLFFREDSDEVEDGYSPVTSEITFRLMGETPQTMTEGKANVLANKIKTVLGTNKGYRFKRGQSKITYLDKDKGYDFRLFVWDKSEGKELITKILDIQNHSPRWDNLSIIQREKTYSTIPGNQLILGKTRRKPRERPVAYVRFRWAELKLHGLVNDIILYDLTGYWRNALVKAD